MAFTRNSSTKEDYELEQCYNRKKYNYNVEKLGFVMDKDVPDALVPGFGVLPATNVPREFMARNAVDIESELRGIRANDFVRGKPFTVTPDNRQVERVVEFFDRPHMFSKIAPIPCVDPYYQEKERPPYH